ncbi:MAG: hypothetical protein IJ644_07115 [Oscillospiraceae bacterium]|nr:hypothetical protein [Oscillospiraceae bacterium]
MIAFGQQDSGQGPFLISLSEEYDNDLKIVVSLSCTGEIGENADDMGIPALGDILRKSCPIYPDENQTYEILFEQYILYQTRNESYTSWDDYEIRKGTYFIIFEKSRLLDALPVLTDCQILSDGTYYPEKWKHYGIYCQNHIIDVISCFPPEIRKLKINNEE